MSKNTLILGLQWGDEGKGKIVDALAENSEAVCRFQGGHNAGHTLVVGENVYKLSLLPSGIVTGTLSIIGNGVVLDPWALRDEMTKLRGQGVSITTENFALADNCALILPIHRDLDGLREAAAGSGKMRRLWLCALRFRLVSPLSHVTTSAPSMRQAALYKVRVSWSGSPGSPGRSPPPHPPGSASASRMPGWSNIWPNATGRRSRQ